MTHNLFFKDLARELQTEELRPNLATMAMVLVSTTGGDSGNPLELCMMEALEGIPPNYCTYDVFSSLRQRVEYAREMRIVAVNSARYGILLQHWAWVNALWPAVKAGAEFLFNESDSIYIELIELALGRSCGEAERRILNHCNRNNWKIPGGFIHVLKPKDMSRVTMPQEMA